MFSLEQAISQLYVTFERYPVHRRMEHCDHCISAPEVQELVAKPLRSLTSEQAGPYSWSAITTWGSVEDFKHFLPRLLELVGSDPANLADPEVILGKLHHGHWLGWPDTEVAAVRSYLQLLWRSALTATDQALKPDTALCAIGQAESDLKPYLEAWLESNSLVAAHRLMEFIDWNVPSLLKKNKLSNAFWERREPQAVQVRDWLRSLALRQKLEAMAMAHSESTLAEPLMAAADRLQVFDSRLGNT